MPSTTLSNDPVSRWACIVITFCSLVLVLVITLFPYDFCFKEEYSGLKYSFFLVGWGESDILDILENVLLFIPLGFGLAGYLTQTIRLSCLASFTVTILVSFGFSYTIEILQVFQPLRFSSLYDVISNSAGSILGIICFLLWGCKDNTSAFVKRNLQMSFLGYAISTFLISITLQHFSSLRNWDKSFPLLLGNELTGDRPWRGYISELYIADRAISETEVAQIFSENKTFDLIGKSLTASYQFTGIGNYHDETKHLPDLIWGKESKDSIQQEEGVFLSQNHWLVSRFPATYLTQRLIGTSQFTLSVTVATGNTMQTGPARIVSLSKDPGLRNFTLGQEGSALIFRLRTPRTGENGADPRLKILDVFSNKNPHNLVITYNGSELFLYVDGVRNLHSLKFNPGTILFSHLFHLNEYNMVGFKILYYALVFIPLGILMTLAVNKTRGRLFTKMLTICGGIVALPFMLENILVGVSGRDLRLENLLISMIFIASPMIFFKNIQLSSL